MNRICNQLPTVVVQRLAEATQSWLLLREIEQRFGDQDGAVGRDMRAAEERIRQAISMMPDAPVTVHSSCASGSTEKP